jgi:hypothetical protein
VGHTEDLLSDAVRPLYEELLRLRYSNIRPFRRVLLRKGRKDQQLFPGHGGGPQRLTVPVALLQDRAPRHQALEHHIQSRI